MLILFGWLLIVVVFFGLAGYLAIVASSAFGGYDFSTGSLGLLKTVSIIQNHKKSHGVLFDLGSSYGNFAIRVQKILPGLEVRGIDSSGIRVFWSKIKAGFVKVRPIFLNADIFKTDISKADAVYIYLPSSLMSSLQKKMQNEMKPGSIVITNTVFFNNWSPVETYITNTRQPQKEKIFVYQI